MTRPHLSSPCFFSAQFDVDKSGEINYNELNRALRRGAELSPELRAGAVQIELTAKNKSPKRPTSAAKQGSGRGGFTASLAANMAPGVKKQISSEGSAAPVS